MFVTTQTKKREPFINNIIQHFIKKITSYDINQLIEVVDVI